MYLYIIKRNIPRSRFLQIPIELIKLFPVQTDQKLPLFIHPFVAFIGGSIFVQVDE